MADSYKIDVLCPATRVKSDSNQCAACQKPITTQFIAEVLQNFVNFLRIHILPRLPLEWRSESRGASIGSHSDLRSVSRSVRCFSRSPGGCGPRHALRPGPPLVQAVRYSTSNRSPPTQRPHPRGGALTLDDPTPNRDLKSGYCFNSDQAESYLFSIARHSHRKFNCNA